MSEAHAAQDGPMTVDQAMAALIPPEAVETEAAPELETPTESQGDAPSPDDAEALAESPADSEETEAEAEPVVALDPPKYWAQDAKAEFAALPPALQAVVLAQEGPREEAAAKAKAEAAEVRQAAETELQKVGQLADALAERLPQWLQSFESKWGKAPDWTAYAQAYGAEAMFLAKTEHDTEREQLVVADRARQVAADQAHEAFVRTEFAKLAEIDAELTHPETGGAKRVEINQYLKAKGYDDDTLRQISATDMVMARKAMLYDRIQASKTARPPPHPVATAPKAMTRPTAAPAQPSQRSAVQTAQSRFNLNPSRENAEALLLAKG